jgi:hypothetical protein
MFTLQQLGAEAPPLPMTFLNYLILPAALVGAWLPWSRFYQSHYLRVASVVMPAVALVTAPFNAHAAAQGHLEVMMLMALQIVGTFQFTGLLFRMALLTCIALVAGFAAGTCSSR